jgi:hypothetical protein
MNKIHADLQIAHPDRVNKRTVQPSTTVYYASTKTNEWYTPTRYIDAVREVFYGRIELDPASSLLSNEVVRAERIYTIDDDGLSQPWLTSTMFLNPPYGRLNGKSQAGVWSQRLITEYKAGNVREAVLLVNASTSESWFQPLLDFPICFTNHRIRFCGPDGNSNSPTKGNAFIYFGNNTARFAAIFENCNIGRVLIRYAPGEPKLR